MWERSPLKGTLQAIPYFSGKHKQQRCKGEIRRLCEKGQLFDALQSAELLQQDGLCICRDDLYWLLRTCIQYKDCASAHKIKSFLDSSGLYTASVLADNLIRLFTLCKSLLDAKDVFAKVTKPTVFTWNAIISACSQLWEPYSGLLYYSNMQCKDVMPDRVTFLHVLKATGSLSSLNYALQAHDNIISKDLHRDVVIYNALIDTYIKCGSLVEARCVFDKSQTLKDVISWNSMISGYAQHGHGIAALDLYGEMLEEGILPDNLTYSSVMKACGSISAISDGRQIHDHINIHGLIADDILGGALIDMYIKCGKVEEARSVFDSLPSCDEVSWSTMISGYTHHGHEFMALHLFGDMQKMKLKVDSATFLSVFKACGLVGALQEGRLAHEQLIEEQLDSEVAVKNAIIDMYAHCLSIEDAIWVFKTISRPDLASWCAIVSGYAACGQGKKMKKSFIQMRKQGLEPDNIMFISILSACSRAGLLDQGRLFFQCMMESYNITPSIEHYNCMADLYSRAGRLDEAQTLLSLVPTLSNAIGWTSFYSGNKVYKSGNHCRI